VNGKGVDGFLHSRKAALEVLTRICKGRVSEAPIRVCRVQVLKVLVRVCKASVAVAVRRSLNCSAVGGTLGGSESLPFGSGSLNDTYSGSLAAPPSTEWFTQFGKYGSDLQRFAQFKGFMKVFLPWNISHCERCIFTIVFHTGIRAVVIPTFLHKKSFLLNRVVFHIIL